jgi:hypothetical protein
VHEGDEGHQGPIIERQNSKPVYVNDEVQALRRSLSRKKSQGPEVSEIVKAEAPNFKMRSGNEYIEEKVERVYGTEFVPGENVKLTPLYNRDEFYFMTDLDERHFKNEERKLVAKRREEYAKKVWIYLFKIFD